MKELHATLMSNRVESSRRLRFSLRDLNDGRLISETDVVFESEIKQNLGGRRRALKFRIDDQSILLKCWRPGSIRQWRNGLRCHTPVDHEVRSLISARKAGLPVPRLLGSGHLGSFRILGGRVLAVHWLDGHRSWRDLVQEARDGDRPELTKRAILCVVKLMAQIRRAGFTDRDFGDHNILIKASDSGIDDRSPLWIDLEGARQATPHDTQATCDIVAAALSSWWMTSSSNRTCIGELFGESIHALPVPDGGWAPLLDQINSKFTARVTREAQKGRSNPTPPALKLDGTTDDS